MHHTMKFEYKKKHVRDTTNVYVLQMASLKKKSLWQMQYPFMHSALGVRQ